MLLFVQTPDRHYLETLAFDLYQGLHLMRRPYEQTSVLRWCLLRPTYRA